MLESGWFKKLVGFGMVAALAVIVVVSMVMFAGGFTETVPVKVTAPRSGLVMDPDAKVKMRGVEVGRVASIDLTADGSELTLDIRPDMLKMIPSNATVDIKSTTVFGAKYVNFVVPQDPSSTPLKAGTTIAADSVTVEFNTLFQHLSDVLRTLEPEKLNATLGALATALQGRGEKVGELLAQTDSYLKKMNPSLPALQRDFAAAAEVTNLYADVSPELLKTLSNVTGTSDTIVAEERNLDSLLLSVIGLSDTVNGVLTENEASLVSALDLLRPTTGLLEMYAPVLNCLIVGISDALPLAEAVFGGNQEGIALNSSFMYGVDPYVYPRDLPVVNATGGPNCYGLPHPVPGEHAPYVVLDTGETPYVPNSQLTVNAPKVFQILFGGMPGVN